MKKQILFSSLIGVMLIILLTVAATPPSAWQPPEHDTSITGVGTDDEPLGVTAPIVYSARITQASTSAPTALEYYNGIDDTAFTLTRDSIGTYKIEGSDAAFPDSVYQFIFTLSNSATTAIGARVYRATDSTLILKVLKSTGYGVDLAGTGSLYITDANPLGE